MRRTNWIIVWLLLALLPLRSWALMGIVPAQGGAGANWPAAHVEASLCHSDAAASHAVHDHAATDEGLPAAEQSHANDADCASVQVCDPAGACHGVAALFDVPAHGAAATPVQSPPGWSEQPFEEPDAQRRFRPPRS